MIAGVYRVIECERLPRQVGPFEFHYSPTFQMAALACACGCGHRVLLNLEDQHTLTVQNGLPTVHPSILVADAPCLSHYFIRGGRVAWAAQWSQVTVDEVMKAQLHRHLERNAQIRPRPSLLQRLVAWIRGLFGG